MESLCLHLFMRKNSFNCKCKREPHLDGWFISKEATEGGKEQAHTWIRPKTNVTGILSVVSTLKCTAFFFLKTTQRTLHECNGFEDVFKD